MEGIPVKFTRAKRREVERIAQRRANYQERRGSRRHRGRIDQFQKDAQRGLDIGMRNLRLPVDTVFLFRTMHPVTKPRCKLKSAGSNRLRRYR